MRDEVRGSVLASMALAVWYEYHQRREMTALLLAAKARVCEEYVIPIRSCRRHVFNCSNELGKMWNVSDKESVISLICKSYLGVGGNKGLAKS